MAGFTNQKGQFDDLFFSNFEKGDVKSYGGDAPKIKSTVLTYLDGVTKETIKEVINTVGRQKASGDKPMYNDKQLSILKKEYATLVNKESTVSGIDTLIKNQFDRVHREIDDYYASDAPMGVVHEISKENDKDYFRVAKLQLGFEEDSKIKFEHLFNNQGEPTDKVLFYQDKIVYNTVKGVTNKQVMRIAEETLTVNEANQKLGMNIDYKRGARYDARVPSKARPIVIGNGLTSSTAKVVNYSERQGDSYKQIYNVAATNYGKETMQMIDSEFRNYVNGDYLIKYEVDPETRQYVAYAYRGKERAFDGVGVPVGDHFATADVNAWLADPKESSRKATDSFLAILDQYKDYYANKKYNTAY